MRTLVMTKGKKELQISNCEEMIVTNKLRGVEKGIKSTLADYPFDLLLPEGSEN